jgi:hypothetical protein
MDRFLTRVSSTFYMTCLKITRGRRQPRNRGKPILTKLERKWQRSSSSKFKIKSIIQTAMPIEKALGIEKYDFE